MIGDGISIDDLGKVLPASWVAAASMEQPSEPTPTSPVDDLAEHGGAPAPRAPAALGC